MMHISGSVSESTEQLSVSITSCSPGSTCVHITHTHTEQVTPVLYNIVLVVNDGPYSDGKFTLVETKVSGPFQIPSPLSSSCCKIFRRVWGSFTHSFTSPYTCTQTTNASPLCHGGLCVFGCTDTKGVHPGQINGQEGQGDRGQPPARPGGVDHSWQGKIVVGWMYLCPFV